MDTFWHDLRYGLRMLVKNPGFTLIAVITLALGIGANTAIFSVVNAVILRPLPYQDSDRLAILWTDDVRRNLRAQATSVATINDWRAQSRAFADLAIFSGNPLVLTGGDERMNAVGEFVSANLFPLLGVAPVLGRTFTVEDEQRGEHVVVLSYGLWQRRFGGASDVIGKTLTIDGDQNSVKQGPRSPQIIGVMPAGFYFPDKDAQLWEPATVYWRWQRESTERFHNRWGVVARLNPDATIRQAQAEMTTIGQQLAQAHPSPNPEFPGFAVNVVPVLDQITGKKLRLALWLLLGSVGVVLLIACVNVANLLLARASTREREFTVRAALGASRARLVRQLLTESFMLAVAAGGLGLVLAAWGVAALAALAPANIARLDEVTVDPRVMLFTAGVSLVAGLVFGLAPAWRVSRSNPNDALKSSSGAFSGGLRLRQMRGALVVVECALTVVLLVGAGLLLRSLHRLHSVSPGFNPEGVLLTSVSLAPLQELHAKDLRGDAVWSNRVAVFRQAMERIGGLPGVKSVGLIRDFLIQGEADSTITVEGRPPAKEGEETGLLAAGAVSPSFFSTMAVPLVSGRPFTDADTARSIRLHFTDLRVLSRPQADGRPLADVAIVNRAFGRRHFPGEDPIGKRFFIGPPGGKIYWYEIVGVVGDMHRQGLEKETIPEYFVPYLGGYSGEADLVVRTGSDPVSLAQAVRQEIRTVDKSAAILKMTTVERLLGELSAERRFQTWLLTLFAALALVLSAIGIFGVIHYAVVQRTREIGIRIALGARSSDVLRLMISQGMKLTLVGMTIGLMAALWLTDVMTHLLFEVSATDPATFVGVALALVGVALMACYLPSRQATRVDPMVALRYE